MTADTPHTTTLPDVNRTRTRTLQVTPRPLFTPENAVVTAVYRNRPTGEPVYYPVEVKRKDLLAALGAEPDETDYREVVAENERLGKNLSRRISEGYRIREALGLSQTAAIEDVLDQIHARKAAEAPENAAEEPWEDQDQIDRSWALEKAGEVLGKLTAVGIDAKACGVSLLPVAEWILDGKPVARG